MRNEPIVKKTNQTRPSKLMPIIYILKSVLKSFKKIEEKNTSSDS